MGAISTSLEERESSLIDFTRDESGEQPDVTRVRRAARVFFHESGCTVAVRLYGKHRYLRMFLIAAISPQLDWSVKRNRDHHFTPTLEPFISVDVLLRESLISHPKKSVQPLRKRPCSSSPTPIARQELT